MEFMKEEYLINLRDILKRAALKQPLSKEEIQLIQVQIWDEEEKDRIVSLDNEINN